MKERKRGFGDYSKVADSSRKQEKDTLGVIGQPIAELAFPGFPSVFPGSGGLCRSATGEDCPTY